MGDAYPIWPSTLDKERDLYKRVCEGIADTATKGRGKVSRADADLFPELVKSTCERLRQALRDLDEVYRRCQPTPPVHRKRSDVQVTPPPQMRAGERNLPVVPNSVEDAEAFAQALGLKVGGAGGWEFAGDYDDKGLYAYNGKRKVFSGHAFFGTGGTEEEMRMPVYSRHRYRPWDSKDPNMPKSVQNKLLQYERWPETEDQQSEPLSSDSVVMAGVLSRDGPPLRPPPPKPLVEKHLERDAMPSARKRPVTPTGSVATAPARCRRRGTVCKGTAEASRSGPRWSLSWVQSPAAPQPPALQIPDWLERKESELYSVQNADYLNLPEAPRMQGIFAKRTIPAGSWLAEYMGERIKGAPGSSYTMSLPGGQKVDASAEELSNWSRYVNAPVHAVPYPFASDTTPGVENCLFIIRKGADGLYRPYICARREIPRGKELLLDYGDKTPIICGWSINGHVPNYISMKKIVRERFTVPAVQRWMDECSHVWTPGMLDDCRQRNGRYRINAEVRAESGELDEKEALARGIWESREEEPANVLRTLQETYWRSLPADLKYTIKRFRKKNIWSLSWVQSPAAPQPPALQLPDWLERK
eukprot:Hpha_TRINITY_DN13005_c0_g1::TRINITY_DN13005_c0_g1_i2::g.68827::m.68827